MAGSCTVRNDLSLDALLAMVPPKWRSAIRSRLSPDTKFCLMLFRNVRAQVVSSRMVASAIRKIEPDSVQTIVAVGHAFTVEADKQLRDLSAEIFQDLEFLWSDDSYRQFR